MKLHRASLSTLSSLQPQTSPRRVRTTRQIQLGEVGGEGTEFPHRCDLHRFLWLFWSKWQSSSFPLQLYFSLSVALLDAYFLTSAPKVTELS